MTTFTKREREMIEEQNRDASVVVITPDEVKMLLDRRYGQRRRLNNGDGR